MIRVFFLCLASFICGGLSSQSEGVRSEFNSSTNKDFTVLKTEEEIKLDGVLDEDFWNKCQVLTDFSINFPDYQGTASGKSEVRISFDDEFLYIGAKCYSKSSDFIVQDLKRDYNFPFNDNISFLFDTYNDQTNALVFGMNPIGVLREATIKGGGLSGSDFDNSWDTRWSGTSKIYDDHWICELKIPFKSLRYKEDSQKWRFNTYRNDIQNNEYTAWVDIPQNLSLANLSRMGDMHWDTKLPKAGKNISIIPYSSFRLARDFENPEEEKADLDFNIGGDLKLGIGSSLNLDLTFNPDFAQVEVDRQVTNLDRFEIFFPERRQFFLENADLFSSFGTFSTRSFFSRRIGIAIDTVTGVNENNAIIYGARLSGKLNETTRIGVLNMMTASQKENDLPAFNYSVAAIEKTIFGQSNLAAILINKEGIKTKDFGDTNNPYNRLLGLEYRHQDKENIWTGKVSYQQIFSPIDAPDKFAHSLFAKRTGRNIKLEWFHMLVGQGFDAEVGFVRRKDILFYSPEIEINFYPDNDKVSNQSIDLDFSATHKLGKEPGSIIQDFTLVDWSLGTNYNVRYSNRTDIDFGFEYKHVTLLEDFDPTGVQADNVFLPAGEEYGFYQFYAGFSSDERKKFSFEITPVAGTFYSGTRFSIDGDVTFRFPPWASISLDYSYNYLDLKDDFVPTKLWLLGPRFNITFSKSIFWSNFLQYNDQQENLNINSRLQWRFAPLSDLFVVYTDNYFAEPFDRFESRNRALVVKLSYWFSI